MKKNATAKNTTKSATLTSVVSKIVSTKKSGSSFTRDSFLSSVAKKMPDANPDSALRILRMIGKATYNRTSGKYTMA